MIQVLGLLLDTLIAGLLAGTIFYAMRLYSSLSSFREHRDDFEHVVSKLVMSIEQAEQAMRNLKSAGTQEAQNLEDLIRHAREMTDELRMVNEASGNMANRLEDLAEKNRKIVEGFDARTPYKAPRAMPEKPVQKEAAPEPLAAPARQPVAEKSKPVAAKQPAKPKPESVAAVNENAGRESTFPSFFIQDRDFDESPESVKTGGKHKGFVDVFEEEDDEEDSPIPPALQSQAERELFLALQKNKRKAASGGQG